MRLFIAIMLVVALLGCFAGVATSANACGGMLTITPPPFDPPPDGPPGPVDPFADGEIDEVIL